MLEKMIVKTYTAKDLQKKAIRKELESIICGDNKKYIAMYNVDSDNPLDDFLKQAEKLGKKDEMTISHCKASSIDDTKPEDSIAAVRDASYYGRNIGEDYPLVCSVPNEDKGSIDIIFSDVHPKTGELGRDLAYNASYYRKECLICTENGDGTFELVPRQSRK